MNGRNLLLIGASVYFASIPFESIRLAFIPIGSAARLAGALFLATLIISAPVALRGRVPVPLLVTTGTFLVLSSASYFWAANPETAWVQVFTFTQLIILFLLLSALRPADRAFDWLTGSWFLSSVCLAVLCISAYFNGTLEDGRATVLGADPNEIAINLSIAFTLSFGTARQLRRTWIALPCRALLIAAILVTGSRTGLIALGLGLAAYLVFSGAKVRLFIAAAIAPFAVIWMLQRLPSELAGRFASIEGEVATGDFGARGHIWRDGLAALADRLFFGWGVGNFEDALLATRGYAMASHNVVVNILVQLGVIGLVLFLAIYFLSVRSGFLAVEGPRRSAFLSAVVVLLIGSLTLTLDYRKVTWAVLALGMLVGAINERLSEKGKGGHREADSARHP